MRNILYRLFRTNRGIRIVVGVLLGVLVLVQWLTPSGANKEVPEIPFYFDDDTKIMTKTPDLVEQIRTLAGKDAEPDHLKLLQICMDEWDKRNVHSYTCKFTKLETIRGKRGKMQVIDVKFRPKPFAVAMKWIKNAPMGDALIYVEGKYKDKKGCSQMVVRPANVLFRKLIKSVKKLPDCKDAMKNTLRPCTAFGFRSGLQNLYNVYAIARERDECVEKYGKTAEIDGRRCVVLERYLSPDRPEYPAYKTISYIDLKYFVPTRIDGFDRAGNMTVCYLFEDIDFNAALKDEDFTPEANGIEVK